MHLGQPGRNRRFIPARAGNTPWPAISTAPLSVHPRACGEHPRVEVADDGPDGSSPRVRGTRISACFVRSVGSVHPRACGEHRRLEFPTASSVGSSPRVRGTPVHVALHAGGLRFIPARAGNTDPAAERVRRAWVHPRACGEHTASAVRFMTCTGSSPRVRGTPVRVASHPHRHRFIPARAGNTGAPAPGSRRSAVHPRACGEHPAIPGAANLFFGSSPRVRGTRARDRGPRRRRRFIPARAGKTHRGGGEARRPRRFIPARAGNTHDGAAHAVLPPVHPRACGEHWARPRSIQAIPGSSPRVRGTRDGGVARPRRRRFIPARAGNTPAAPAAPAAQPVHPRACGEHRSRPRAARGRFGSSPRVRGTPRRDEQRPQLVRFIPARAGNTHAERSGAGSRPVHPRACGEHRQIPRAPGPAVGSSPRVRGTLPDRQQLAEPFRFIPARAGNTQPPGVGDLAPHGSSPRVRGTQPPPEDGQVVTRFIPARAGNTTRRLRRAADQAVHPRACGEHPAPGDFGTKLSGSSPRVRGTRMPPRPFVHVVRFIPARAGNTTRACSCSAASAGSSPRVRGTPAPPAEADACRRFIPARAGNTRLHASSSS